jgi:DinB superfamily
MPRMPVVGSETRVAVPADLQEVIDALTAVERDAERIVAPLDDEQFNWSPASGAWSIAQCLDHLNVANARYFGGVTAAVARAEAGGLTRRGPIQSSFLGRWFVAMLEPPVRLKARAPGNIRPARRRHKAEVWPEFVRQHTHMRASIAGWGQVDLNRAVFPNPLARYGRVRAGTGLRIIAAHDRRHVWQASRVRAAEGFPRS